MSPGFLAALVLGVIVGGPPALAQQQGAPAGGAPNDVIVRTLLQPETGAVIGQRVALLVDVLFRGDMPRPPRVTIPDLPAAQVFRFETQATTIRETINGADYTGQRFEFAIYPRRGGELVVPPAAVTLLDKAGEVVGAARGAPVHTQTLVPDKVDPSQPLVATRRLTLDETWAPDRKTAFKTGDALVRTVTRTADDVPSLAMRGLAFAAPDGVQVYVDPPDSRDEVDRGSVTGRRIDRATFVFETAGKFSLPAVAQPWWDLGENRLRTAEGGGVSVSVSAVPLSTPGRGAAWRTALWLTLPAMLIGIAAAWWLATGGAAALRARWHRHWRLAAQSEAKAFSDLLAVCPGGRAAAVYRAFALWRMRFPAAAAASAAPLADDLERALYAGGGDAITWSAERALAFAQRLREARPALIGNAKAVAASALPPLNPPQPASREV